MNGLKKEVSLNIKSITTSLRTLQVLISEVYISNITVFSLLKKKKHFCSSLLTILVHILKQTLNIL